MIETWYVLVSVFDGQLVSAWLRRFVGDTTRATRALETLDINLARALYRHGQSSNTYTADTRRRTPHALHGLFTRDSSNKQHMNHTLHDKNVNLNETFRLLYARLANF